MGGIHSTAEVPGIKSSVSETVHVQTTAVNKLALRGQTSNSLQGIIACSVKIRGFNKLRYLVIFATLAVVALTTKFLIGLYCQLKIQMINWTSNSGIISWYINKISVSLQLYNTNIFPNSAYHYCDLCTISLCTLSTIY